VHKAARVVYKDVSVVPIFYLQYKTNNTVRSQTLNEIQSGVHKPFAALVSVFFEEVVIQVYFKCFAYLVAAVGVGDYFDYAAEGLVIPRSIRNTFIRSNVQIQPTHFEYFLEHFDKLEGEYVLADVVVYLKNARYEFYWFHWISYWAGSFYVWLRRFQKLRLINLALLRMVQLLFKLQN